MDRERLRKPKHDGHEEAGTTLFFLPVIFFALKNSVAKPSATTRSGALLNSRCHTKIGN